MFPGLSDLMHKFDDLDNDEKLAKIKEVKKHLSDLMIVFRQATSWLLDTSI